MEKYWQLLQQQGEQFFIPLSSFQKQIYLPDLLKKKN
jgi:hypothetical protein